MFKKTESVYRRFSNGFTIRQAQTDYNRYHVTVHDEFGQLEEAVGDDGNPIITETKMYLVLAKMVAKYIPKPALWLVVSGQGYWGKGDTLAEAMSEAQVKGVFVPVQILQCDRAFIADSCVGDMGGLSWMWTDEVTEYQKQGLQRVLVQKGRAKISNKKVVLELDALADGPLTRHLC